MQKAGTITAIVFSAVMLPALALSQNTGSGNSRDNGQTRDSREQMRFRAMDTDNDGVITRDEWQGNAQSFREHDLNHDGEIDFIWRDPRGQLSTWLMNETNRVGSIAIQNAEPLSAAWRFVAPKK